MIRRLVSSAALAAIALLAVAAPVSAHIDPDPTEARAGSRLTVGFTVEHGCDGSPTTQLDMRLPEGVADAIPESVDGWEGSVETVDGDTIVSFVGGPLADDVEGTFAVTMTLPPTPDTTIYFPFVQRCEVGEIRWIGIPAEPGDELDEPAPAMALVGPVAAAPPDTTPPDTATPAAAAPTTAPEVTDAVQNDVTATTASATSEPVLISEGTNESVNSGTGTIVFIASIACVLGLGAYVVYRSRQTRAVRPS